MADIYIMKVKDDAGKIYDIYFYEGIYDGVFSDNGGSITNENAHKVSWDGVPLTEGAFLPINNMWCYDSQSEHCIANGYPSDNLRVFRLIGNNHDYIRTWSNISDGVTYIYNLEPYLTSIAGVQNHTHTDIYRTTGSIKGKNGVLLLIRDNEGRHGIFCLNGPMDIGVSGIHADSVSVIPGDDWGVAGITIKEDTSQQWGLGVLVIPDDVLINKTKQDPFEPGGNSGTGGGQGNFDGSSEPIDFPPMPTLSAADTNFITLYNPTLAQLRELSSYMWSDLFSLDTLKKIFADPMDCILGLSIVPVDVPDGGAKEVKVGNISTGVNMSVASTQFVKVDCGSINVNEYWGAYLDYEPYTQAQIFLPYIGTRPISVDEIMGKTVHVVYHVDILSGACCCFVKCGDSVLYTFNGQCSIPIPVTGANYTSIVNGVINIAASVGSLVATGGQAAPLIAAGSAAGATKAAVAKGAAAKAQLTNAQIGTGSSVASNVANQMKPQIAKSGSISGGAGILNMQTPYLILIRPRQALPSKQNEFIGYPSLITVQLSELSGYTEVQSIHLENIPATSQELDEIEGLLKEGVIF